MSICEKAKKNYSDADLIICINNGNAEIRKTNIPFRLISPMLKQYEEKMATAMELIANVADTIEAVKIVIERYDEMAAIFYTPDCEC